MKILISGCGPKALAIYAKMRGLEEAGFEVPEIVILEKFEVAAHWGGAFGFTDGLRSLGTPPEKDIGYPYNSVYKDYGAPEIDSFLFRLSWPSYMIAKRSYADYTDRGRPAPPHREWAKYMGWVTEKLDLHDSGSYIHGTLKSIGKREERWVAHYTPGDLQDGEAEIECDAIVITGPGEPKRAKNQAENSSSIMDGQSFWKEENIGLFQSHVREEMRIAIIGAGETTASVVTALLHMNAQDWTIDVISRRGTLYSRGEGYHENRFFSDPTNWGKLSEALRVELIERTDRGVLSVKAMQDITAAKTVSCRHGTVASITWARQTKSGPKIKILMEDGTEEIYDRVIVALGFDPISFGKHFKDNPEILEPLVPGASPELLEMLVGRTRPHTDHNFLDGYRKILKACALNISENLCVTGLEPRLYLPMMAGLTQGPGFPNLSCLGILSDRILRHGVETLNPERFKR